MNDIRSRLDEISDILTIPDVLVEVNTLIRSPYSSASDIAKVINRDLALSAKILKLVNSPYYGFTKQITSINYAIVILGYNTIRDLAISVFILDLIDDKECGDFNPKSFWQFSVNVGIIAEHLVERSRLMRNDGIYVAGLLHEIGVVILNQFFPDEFSAAYRYARENNCTLLQAENTILDFNHIVISEYILQRWNFPETILDVCRYCYSPEISKDLLPYVIHMSNIFCRVLRLGNPADNAIPELSAKALNVLNIDENNFYGLFKDILKITIHSVSQIL